MSSAAAVLASIVAFAAAAAAAPGEPNAIAPGYWETTNQVVSPVRSTKVERRCIRPEEVAKFMEGPSNHIYRCTYPTRIVGRGTIRLKGSCSTKKGPALPVSGEGSFTRDSFHMEARVAAQLGAMSIPIRAVTDAKRLSDACPTPTEAPEAR